MFERFEVCMGVHTFFMRLRSLIWMSSQPDPNPEQMWAMATWRSMVLITYLVTIVLTQI